MELTKVVPKMEETSGKIVYAGMGKVLTQGYGRNSRVAARTYNLYSDRQRADDVSVIVTGNTFEKAFEYEEEVVLVNPVIKAEGRNIQGRGSTNYLLYADDIISATEAAEQSKQTTGRNTEK